MSNIGMSRHSLFFLGGGGKQILCNWATCFGLKLRRLQNLNL